jgi:hypothetical protein
MNTDSIVQSLLESDEPAIRFKIRVGFLGEDPNSKSIVSLRNENPDDCHSSFMESILPMRSLAYYGKLYDHKPSLRAAKRAADVFLKRCMYLRESEKSVIRDEFTQLHYPLYWHYDILHGLKVMAVSGFIGEKQCKPALDLWRTNNCRTVDGPRRRNTIRRRTS